MTQIDHDAAFAAKDKFESVQERIGTYGATCSAIRTYRQAECKPISTAPKTETPFEVWHIEQRIWLTIRFIPCVGIWQELIGPQGYLALDCRFSHWREQVIPACEEGVNGA
ncbi:MAG: hypothetical protein P1U50_00885 [Parvibaculaceae bacterium]|nr:hypothetical protein [Parvibaculaceae bacterium]